MPVTRSKAAQTATTTAEIDPDGSASAGHSFENVFTPNAVFASESEHSDYGKKGRRTTITRLRRRRRRSGGHEIVRTPLPPMSDEDDIDSRLGSPALGDSPDEMVAKAVGRITARAVTRPARKIKSPGGQVPAVLQIQVTTPPNGSAVINLNLTDILAQRKRAGVDPDRADTADVRSDGAVSRCEGTESTRAVAPSRTRSAKRARTFPPQDQAATATVPHIGFLDLPYELRARVYRQVFVTEAPIDFERRADFARSAAFLRTCRLVHAEGREILYGENAFHFERTEKTRGRFYEPVWKEIGYKDVRRFLVTIGDNISCLKYVSFLLLDGAPSITPYLDAEERRFVHDPVLFAVFELIGRHAVLSKLAVTFAAHRMISTTDYNFLKYLTGIKCHEFIHGPRLGFHVSKASDGLVQKMTKVMVVARQDGGIDTAKTKPTTAAAAVVRMYHEKPWAAKYSA